MGFYNPPTTEPASSITVGTTTVVSGTPSGILWNNAGVLAAGPATTDATGNIALPSAAALKFSGGSILINRAANAVEMRNGTGAQSFRLYNTFTDVSNDEFADLTWQTFTNVFAISTVGNGTGSNRTIRLNPGAAAFDFTAAGAFASSSTIATAAPAGASAGAWKLGSLVAGAVVLDTTRSVYIDIGGTVYKLMVAQ